MNSPVDGFTVAETFTGKLSFGTVLGRLMPLLVLLCLIGLLILSGILHSLGTGELTWPLALVLTIAFAVVLVKVKKRQFDRTSATVVLELSPAGAVMVGSQSRVDLAWDHIHSLGKTSLVNVRSAGISGPSVVLNLVSGLVLALVRRRTEDALIGAAGQATGERLTTIVLTTYDPNWRTGRIGDWIRAYRPDLLDR